MKVPVIRNQFTRDNKRLSRARKLYARFIYRACMKSPDLTFLCAQRAIARGLYAHTTGIGDVTFSLVRKFYMIEARNGCPWTWRQWLREVDHADWYALRRFGRLNVKKPVLRVVA